MRYYEDAWLPGQVKVQGIVGRLADLMAILERIVASERDQP